MTRLIIYGILAAVVMAALTGVYLGIRHQGVLAERAVWAKAVTEKCGEKAKTVEDCYLAGATKEQELQQAAATKVKLEQVIELAKLDEQRRQAEKEALAAKRKLERMKNAYITPVADAKCTLTRGVVLYHDAAATGSDIETAPAGPEPNDAASPVKIADFASTVGENYAYCNDLARQVTGLIDYVQFVVKPE